MFVRIHPLISAVVGERAVRPISVISVVSAIGTALSPALFKVPLFLAMLSPRLPFLVLAAVGTNPVLFVALLGARLSITDWHWFDLGRRHGRTLLLKYRLTRRLMQCSVRIQKCAVLALLMLRPISRHLMLSGVVGLKTRTVFSVDVVSTVLYLALIVMTVRGLR